MQESRQQSPTRALTRGAPEAFNAAMLEVSARPSEAALDARRRCLAALERKVLWLACWTIHHANHIRPNRDGVKVGGHQASCASVASLMTALYFDVVRPEDRVAVKPHASPIFHAIMYLCGRQTREASWSASAPSAACKPTLAHQGHRAGRFFDRLGGARRRVTLFACWSRICLHAPWPEGRAPGRMIALDGRCRARRGQCLRGPARRLEARRAQSLVGDRLQPPEPRRGGGRSLFQKIQDPSSPPSAGTS